MDRAINLLDVLLPIQSSIDELFEIEKKYQAILFEPRLLSKYRKDWVAFLIAFRLYNNYRMLKPITAANVKNTIEQIRVYNRELAEEVEKIFPLVEEGRGLFSDLLNELRKGKEYFVSYISTHLQELITKAKSIKDEKLSRQLVTLFSSISGHEVEYLVRYRLDADNWPNYVIGNGIDFFIRRINLFIKGGFEGNIRFMGLYKDFGDVELTKTMLKDNAIRSLWTYQNQLWYINYLIQLCKKSEISGEWKGFYGKRGFWGKEGDEKGKNFDRYAEEFLTKYGNKDFRNTLIAKKHQIGENPEGWGGLWEGNRLVKDGELPRLLRILQHPSYQRQKIILTASIELRRIFKGREDELKAKRDEFVDELIKLLQEAEGIGIARKKVIRKFARLLRRRKKYLLRQLEIDITNLINRANVPWQDYNEFTKSLDSVTSKMDFWYIRDQTRKLVSKAKKLNAFVLQQLQAGLYLRDVRQLYSVDFADRMTKVAMARKTMLERFEHLSEGDFRVLQELSSRAPAILRRLRGVYRYIQYEVEQKCTIKYPKDLEEVDFKNLKNKDFRFGYVKEMFNRLI